VRRRVLSLVLLVLAAPACTSGFEQAADLLEPPADGSPPVVTPAVSPAGPDASSSGTVPGIAPIQIRAPIEGDDVLSPLVVSGTAVSATGEIVVRVIGADRSELASVTATIDCGMSCRGRFRVALAFYTPERQGGAVQAFEVGSAGSIDHLVEVPVTLVPGV